MNFCQRTRSSVSEESKTDLQKRSAALSRLFLKMSRSRTPGLNTVSGSSPTCVDNWDAALISDSGFDGISHVTEDGCLKLSWTSLGRLWSSAEWLQRKFKSRRCRRGRRAGLVLWSHRRCGSHVRSSMLRRMIRTWHCLRVRHSCPSMSVL